MSDLGISAPAEGTDTNTPAPEATPAADPYAPVVSRVDELAGRFDDFRQLIDQRLPAPEPVAEPSPWDALFPEAEEPDPYAAQQPQGIDPQQLQAAFAQAVQQANAPLQAQLQAMQTQAAHDQLVKDIPQLANTPENQATRQATAQAVQQSVSHLPDHIGQALAADPKYIATIFKAAEADKRAQGQQPASEAVPSLEAAGGAVPGGNGEQPSYVQNAHAAQWSLPPGLR